MKTQSQRLTTFHIQAVYDTLFTPMSSVAQPNTSLKGKIAIVTGSSRGAGRGIALALGDVGATVYVTGRSVRGKATTEDLPGTIDETAEGVTARGGEGIAVRCDHTVDADVDALFARVQQEHGRIDLLVNNAWGGYEQHDFRKFTAPFTEQPLRHWDGMFTAGVRATLVASRFAALQMLPQKCGLIVNVTAWDRDKYFGNLLYDVAKGAILVRLTQWPESSDRTTSRSSRSLQASSAPNGSLRHSKPPAAKNI